MRAKPHANPHDDPEGPSAFITAAYALHDQQSIQDFYKKWATEYDAQMLSEGYLSPRAITLLLHQYLLIKKPLIIDIGCGTGMTGSYVDRANLQALDGIDLSPEMLAVAKRRGIYRHLYTADLNQPLPFNDNRYDAAISSGTFTHGHVGAAPIAEIFRILKPGGVLACTVHFKLWHAQGFDKMFADLIAAGAIKRLLVQAGAYYQNAADEGWFCIYQKQPDCG